MKRLLQTGQANLFSPLFFLIRTTKKLIASPTEFQEACHLRVSPQMSLQLVRSRKSFTTE